MTDYIIKLSTEQLSGSITYVNSPDPPSSPTLEVEDFWRIRLKAYLFLKIIGVMCMNHTYILEDMVGYVLEIYRQRHPANPVFFQHQSKG